MRVADFTFELPDSLIARHPLAERRGSRLLTLDGPSGALAHRQFTDLLEHLRPGDLMVFNNTRVIPARLFGQKASGGKLEILVERVLDTHRVLAHVRSSKSPKPGSKILIDGGGEAEMLARHDALFELGFAEEVLPLLDRVGHMPLPPYIDRPDEGSDRERYQTVYAQRLGAVAAPTAGLHFDQPLMEAIAAKGIETMGQDAAEYTRKSFEGMTAIVKSLAAVKSPTEFMKLQSDYVRTSFDSMVAESSKTTETMLKLAGEIAQPISNRVAVAAEKIKISA